MSWKIDKCPVCEVDPYTSHAGFWKVPDYAKFGSVLGHMRGSHSDGQGYKSWMFTDGCPICSWAPWRDTSELALHFSTTHTQEEFEAAVALLILGQAGRCK